MSLVFSCLLPKQRHETVRVTIFRDTRFDFCRFCRQAEPKSEKVPSLQMNYEAKNLKKQEQFEFWVTASTNVGEGQPSKTITIAPNSRGKKIGALDSRITTRARQKML